MNRQRRALFLLPCFSRFAGRRPGLDLERFFNPQASFDRVVIASPGERRRQTLGSLRIEPLPAAASRPWAIGFGDSAFGRFDPLADQVRQLAARHQVRLLAQRYGGPLFHGLPVVWAARRLGLPALITLQNDYAAIRRQRPLGRRWARRLLDPPAWRYLLRHATAIWCVSEHVRARALEAGAPGASLLTIPNKEDLKSLRQAPAPDVCSRLRDRIDLPGQGERRPVFLSVGRLVAQKNYPRMLAAFGDFRRSHPGAAWIIVGQGPERSRLERRIERLGLRDAVWIVGRDLAIEELAVLYHGADALLFVSLFEGHGRVAYEAMACGTPVVGSRRPPIAEMVIDGETGATADPESPADIRDAMERVNQTDLAESCRCLAHRYDLDRVEPLEADLYRRLLASGS